MWSPFGAWQYLALRDGAGGWPVGAMAPAAHLKKKKKNNVYMVIMKDTTSGIMGT
jgi:hypothetical protein